MCFKLESFSNNTAPRDEQLEKDDVPMISTFDGIRTDSSAERLKVSSSIRIKSQSHSNTTSSSKVSEQFPDGSG
jgi:hypothetical protein